MSHTAVELPRARRWAAAAVLSASLLVITLDLTILNIALPEIAIELNASANQLLWIVDAYSLVLAGLLVSTASLGDRWGRKLMLLAGFALFGGASALVLIANSAPAVIALRALLGLGGAMIMPTTLSMLRAVFTDPAERASALGLWAAVAGLGAALGPIIGGLLIEYFSWHAAFLVNAPLMVIAIIAAVIILPESKHPTPGAWDITGALYSIASMVLIVWSIKRFAHDESLLSLPALIAFGAGATLMTLFVVRCLRREHPLLDVRLFTRRPFTAGVVAALGASFALASALLLLAQWLQLVEGHSPLDAGIRLLPLSATSLVSSLAAAPLARRIGARAVLAGGLGLSGVGILYWYVAPAGLTYSAAAVGMVLVSMGIGALAVASALIMSGTPPEKAGDAAAIEEISYDLGNVLGVAILGSVAALFYRAELRTTELLGQLAAINPKLADAAEQSIGNAVQIADELSLPDVAEVSGTAFSHALQQASLFGGITLIAVAVLTFVLIPKETDITMQQH